MRICKDFHALNSNTKLDVFPLPCIANLLDRLGKAKYLSSIDLAIAYHYVRIAEGDRHKTAFFTNEGLYEYIVMLFGLCNAPEAFQRLINLTFSDYINVFVIIYLNHILVFSETHY